VDLPTPPLPLAMATMRWIPGTLFWFCHGLAAPAACGPVGGLTSTCTMFTPGNALSARSLSALICCTTSGVPDVNCIETLTAPLFALICLTRPNETMSRL